MFNHNSSEDRDDYAQTVAYIKNKKSPKCSHRDTGLKKEDKS